MENVQFRKDIAKWDTHIIHGTWWDSPKSPICAGWCHCEATLAINFGWSWQIGEKFSKTGGFCNVFPTFIFSELLSEEYTDLNLFIAIGILKEKIFRTNITCLDSSTSIHLYVKKNSTNALTVKGSGKILTVFQFLVENILLNESKHCTLDY